MSDLKIYVRDMDCQGSHIIVASSFEEARKVLLDPSIEYWKEQDRKHQEAEANGREPRTNPWASMWQVAETHPELHIDEYEITDGLQIEIEGE